MGLNRLSEAIIEKAKHGDVHAFRIIVEEHQNFVYSVAFRFVNSTRDAEDIAQETFLRLWKHMSRYDSGVRLTTWLYKIVTNVSLDHLKSTQHRRSSMEVDLKPTEQMIAALNADQPLIDEELRRAVAAAAESLTPKQKAVFVLRDLEGLAVSEVSAVLRMSAGSIKSNLCLARKRIAEVLTKYYSHVNG